MPPCGCHTHIHTLSKPEAADVLLWRYSTWPGLCEEDVKAVLRGPSCFSFSLNSASSANEDYRIASDFQQKFLVRLQNPQCILCICSILKDKDYRFIKCLISVHNAVCHFPFPQNTGSQTTVHVQLAEHEGL